MCGPDPCKSPTPCGRCERGAVRLTAMEVGARSRSDDARSPEVARAAEDRVTRVLRVMPTTD